MAHIDAITIDQLGGSTKVAKLLGMTTPGSVQRVANWRVRGIPAAVKIEHKQYFLKEEVFHDSSVEQSS